MTIRQRKKTLGRAVEDLDVFPKVPDSYVEQESSSALGTIFKLKNISFEIMMFFKFFYSLPFDVVSSHSAGLVRMAVFFKSRSNFPVCSRRRI
jgi:hypothetical protein